MEDRLRYYRRAADLRYLKARKKHLKAELKRVEKKIESLELECECERM